MIANPVMSRMLWKEFCALRLVWIACVLGVLFLNATLTVSAAAYNWHGYSGVFWGLAMVVPAAYVVACTAMTFAGEREDRTADWLVALAPPFASLYVSKQAFILVSGLAMQLFLAAAAACFMLADRNEPSLSMQYQDVLETLRVSEFVFVECLVWGTFWSLQTGKAVNAIFKTIATLIVIFVVSGFSMDLAALQGNRGRGLWYGAFDTFGWLRTTWTVGVIAASWVLGHRWLDGRGIEWEVVIARWFQRRIPKARTAARERGEPWQRTWQRLRWLEFQSLKSFAAITAAASVLSLPTVLFGARPTLGWMLGFGCLLIFLGGLMSWRGEQTRQQYRLLVNFGVSPAAVWLNKFCQWFLATLAALVVVALPTLILWQSLSAAYPLSTPGYGPKWPSYFGFLAEQRAQFPLVFWSTATMFVLYGLMMFAATFTWSLLCRKGVIAFGMALVTISVLAPWYGLVGALGMPLWLFLGPLPIWLLAISYRHLPAWWEECSGWRVWLPRAIEFMAVPAVLCAGAIAYRVYEIPHIPFESVFRSPTPPANHAASREANLAAWRRVRTVAVESLPRLEKFAPSAEAPENGPELSQTDRLIAHWEDELVTVRDAVLATQGLMDPNASDWKTGRNQLAVTAQVNFTHWLARKATLTTPSNERRITYLAPDPDRPGEMRRVEETRLTSESPSWLEAAVILGGASHRYVPLSYQRLVAQHDAELFQEMIAWAQHPGQTEDTLRLGLLACSKTLPMWSMNSSDIQANLDWERGVKENRRYWPWEEARRQRLLDIAAVNQVSYLNSIQQGYGTAAFNPEPSPFLSGPLRTAWKTVPGDVQVQLHSPYVTPIVGLDAGTVSFLHDAEARYRATVATMVIVGYRRLHGRLPVSWSEAVAVFGPKSETAQDVLRDPYSWEWFHYEPAGFALPPEVPAGNFHKPLLWSGGPNHYQLRPSRGSLLMSSSHRGYLVVQTVLAESNRSQELLVFTIPPLPDAAKE